MADEHGTRSANPDVAARDQPNPEQSAAPGPETNADTAPEPQFDDLWRRTERYLTVFQGPVYTGGGIAFGKPGRHAPAMGDVDEVDHHAALAYFVGQPAFLDASKVLHQHRLVVLSGKVGTGRRCGALTLLTRSAPPDVDCREPLVELSPRTTTAELLDVTYAPGGRYLLTEYEPDDDGIDAERMRFDLDRLRRRLAELGAVLVATSSDPALASHELAVPWRMIDPCRILDKYLDGRNDEYDEQTLSLLRGVAADRRPGDMPAFFRLLEQEGHEAVERHFDHSERNELRKQFFERAQDVPTLLPLVAAAFLPGAVERNYEAHLDQLHDLVDRHARRSPWTRTYDGSLAQSRTARLAWVESQVHPFDPRERAVKVTGRVSSEFLLAELHEHYGRELWAPVHTWLLNRPNMIDNLGDEQALATGMAAFARVDPVGADVVLDAWAQDKSLAHRLAAAATVSALCAHEDTVDDALRRAIRWSSMKPRLQIVAAMAFGQALSRNFPVEAMSYLWYLGLGNAVVAGAARKQFTALVRVSARDDDQIRLTLSIVAWQLQQLLEGRAYRDKSVGQATETVSSILSVQLAENVSLTLHVLHRLPDQIPRIGSLWAEVLRSWPHRTAALELLLAAHDDLEPAGGASLFAALGKAIRPHLTPPEWQWVCRDLGVPTWTPSMRADDVGTEVPA